MAKRKGAEPAFDTAQITHADVPVALVDPHKLNYNVHDDDQIAALTESIHRFGGQVRSVVVWARPGGRYTMIAGHGFLEAAKREGLTTVRADVLPASVTPADAAAYLVADNLLADRSHADETLLTQLLEEQKASGFSLHALGASDELLADLHERIAQRALRARQDADNPADDDEDDAADWGENAENDEDDENADPFAPTNGGPADPYGPQGEAGALLARLNLDLLEPRYRTVPGDVWRLGGLHTLIVADVFRDWQLWQPWLARACAEAITFADAHGYDRPREVIFGPFAGPFVLLSERAERKVHVVAVQPDPWIAGHILSLYADVHGQESVQHLVSGEDGEEPIA